MLNAFRHQRSEQIEPRMAFPQFYLCSTPFGIKDRNSCRLRYSPTKAMRAQRLSASKIGTDVCMVHLSLVLPVLNAFRHQRSEQTFSRRCSVVRSACSTPFGIKDRNRVYFKYKSVGETGAQRLSASKIGTGLPLFAIGASGVVLNAFRHQRSEQLYTSTTPKDATTVLNAFRHQRSEQKGYRTAGAQALRCSTPFGIKDRNRATAAGKFLDGVGCSTPFGIKDRNSYKAEMGGTAFRKCSTPFGIKDRNSIHSRIAGDWPSVLNAFRHQRSEQGTNTRRILAYPCAQRLSASKIGTDTRPRWAEQRSESAQRLSASKIGTGRKIGAVTVYSMCSTPFGIKDRNRRHLAGASVNLRKVLNAFRHQRSEQSSACATPNSSNACSTPFGIKDRNRIVIVYVEPVIGSAQRLSASKIGTGETGNCNNDCD